MSFYGPSWVSVFSLESLNAGSQVKKTFIFQKRMKTNLWTSFVLHSLVRILQIHLYKELEGTCTFCSIAIPDFKK